MPPGRTWRRPRTGPRNPEEDARGRRSRAHRARRGPGRALSGGPKTGTRPPSAPSWKRSSRPRASRSMRSSAGWSSRSSAMDGYFLSLSAGPAPGARPRPRALAAPGRAPGRLRARRAPVGRPLQEQARVRGPAELPAHHARGAAGPRRDLVAARVGGGAAGPAVLDPRARGRERRPDPGLRARRRATSPTTTSTCTTC